MVIMALDHVRDFFTNVHYDPTDLSQTNIPLFFTRFITHYCAPVFVFLSGVSIYLGLSKGKSKAAQSRFLLTRGLWLVFAEITLVNIGWSFDISMHFLVLGVIWVIGWSMIILAALIYVKPLYVGCFGLLLIAGHNLLDPIRAASMGSGSWFWKALHESAIINLSYDRKLYLLYPLIPWVGVMALGYWGGGLYKQEAVVRKRILLRAGCGALLLFVVIRWVNIYGDLVPRVVYNEGWKTVLSFINVSKYPPSLDYLLITLGPALIVLSAIDSVQVKASNPALVFGRVPFFYYLLHLYLARSLGYLAAVLTGVHSAEQWTGFGLPVVYGVWLFVVIILYFPCKWYMKFKAKRNDWWLSYL
ncbi:hypothetical protein FLA_1140 [Filimonas lacunae]|nr:hypothetical protein FLA_1140 [Filimonas lacunae]